MKQKQQFYPYFTQRITRLRTGNCPEGRVVRVDKPVEHTEYLYSNDVRRYGVLVAMKMKQRRHFLRERYEFSDGEIENIMNWEGQS